MNFYQSFVNQRLRTLTTNEIVRLGPNNGGLIDLDEASKVSRLLHSLNLNVFNKDERLLLYNQITSITSQYVASEFDKIIEYYISKKKEWKSQAFYSAWL